MSGKLKEIKGRIGSVTDIQQITRAMKMVSAAKLRRAQEAIHKLRPYDYHLRRILQHVMTANREVESPYLKPREPEKVLIVLITSDKGLCGSFNVNLFRQVTSLLNNTFAEQHKAGNVSLYCIGKKGKDYFKSKGLPLIDTHVGLFNRLSFNASTEASNDIMEQFIAGKFDRVAIVYAEFKNAVNQVFHAEQFLPVPPLEEAEQESTGDYVPDFIFEPSEEAILRELVPLILKTYLYRALRDSFASEHGARMTAMDSATENANELLQDLRLSYNRARQEAITKELSEIVGGANALEST